MGTLVGKRWRARVARLTVTATDGSSHYQRSISLDFRPKLQYSHAMQLNSYMPTLRRQHVRIQHHSMAGSRCSRISGLSGNKSANQRQKFVRERKDPAKMTNSRRALSRRGLGIRPARAKSGATSHSAGHRSWTCAFSRSSGSVRAQQRTPSGSHR